MAAAADLDREKRSVSLQRLGAMLNIRGRKFSHDDLIEITKLALTGLTRQPAV
jgi:hypothetical protein